MNDLDKLDRWGSCQRQLIHDHQDKREIMYSESDCPLNARIGWQVIITSEMIPESLYVLGHELGHMQRFELFMNQFKEILEKERRTSFKGEEFFDYWKKNQPMNNEFEPDLIAAYLTEGACTNFRSNKFLPLSPNDLEYWNHYDFKFRHPQDTLRFAATINTFKRYDVLKKYLTDVYKKEQKL